MSSKSEDKKIKEKIKKSWENFQETVEALTKNSNTILNSSQKDSAMQLCTDISDIISGTNKTSHNADEESGEEPDIDISNLKIKINELCQVFDECKPKLCTSSSGKDFYSQVVIALTNFLKAVANIFIKGFNWLKDRFGGKDKVAFFEYGLAQPKKDESNNNYNQIIADYFTIKNELYDLLNSIINHEDQQNNNGVSPKML